jgi:membrane-bound serine protease (ClpP class)
MASDVAAMAPSTNTGAAHPISSGGEIVGIPGKKAEEDAAANIRTLAERMGRNVKLAEKAVVESDSYTEKEALDGKLVEVVAPNLAKLLRAIDGRQIKKGERTITLATADAEVREIETSTWRRVLGVLADPNIAYLFLTLGFLGLYFELMHPGAILPGVLGGIFLILAFFGLSVLPVNYAGLALILLAVVLFIAEIKVTSYGMLTVAGVISLVLGSLMLFKTAEPALRVSISLIATLAATALLLVGFLLWRALWARRRPVTTGREGLLGLPGTARSALAPRGKVLVFGEIWDAVAEEPVPPGEEIEVVRVENMTLVVRRRRPN